MSLINKVNEELTFELRPGASGFGVDSIIHKNGRRYINQVFWHENEEVARAFFNGIKIGAMK